MLQKNTIKIKKELEKEEEKIIEYMEATNYVHNCPCCGSADIVRNGTYLRNIIFLRNGRISVRKIRMQRFLCKKCRKTRTHYPAFVVPKKEYSMGILITIMVLGKKVLTRLGIPESQVRELRKKNKIVINKMKQLLYGELYESIEEIVNKYEEKYMQKPFYPYQRDVYLKAIGNVMYTAF